MMDLSNLDSLSREKLVRLVVCLVAQLDRAQAKVITALVSQVQALTDLHREVVEHGKTLDEFNVVLRKYNAILDKVIEGKR